jgi:hypothetical protein
MFLPRYAINKHHTTTRFYHHRELLHRHHTYPSTPRPISKTADFKEGPLGGTSTKKIIQKHIKDVIATRLNKKTRTTSSLYLVPSTK